MKSLLSSNLSLIENDLGNGSLDPCSNGPGHEADDDPDEFY